MKFLIIDDSPTMRRILRVGIEKSLGKGTTLLEAENGEEGLETLRANPDIDYTFLDINMPVMKGDKMLEIVRKDPSLRHHKIIIQTTEGKKEKFLELKQMGISGYLLKPYTQPVVQKLIDAIAQKAEVACEKA